MKGLLYALLLVCSAYQPHIFCVAVESEASYTGDHIIGYGRRLDEDDDGDEDWFDLSIGERVAIVIISIVSAAFSIGLCIYIKCYSEKTSSVKTPLTSQGASGMDAPM
mmetsp:Transcript_21697/g.31574  ORF Transcript_21697/g.31574 Transcript_21697/m.31574 type:complete len:108 (-) Transcript_21697:152-475(-)